MHRGKKEDGGGERRKGNNRGEEKRGEERKAPQEKHEFLTITEALQSSLCCESARKLQQVSEFQGYPFLFISSPLSGMMV